jgi:hypothetical protein
VREQLARPIPGVLMAGDLDWQRHVAKRCQAWHEMERLKNDAQLVDLDHSPMFAF